MRSNDEVNGLRFLVRELAEEASALKGMAAGFLADDGPLSAFEGAIDRIGDGSGERNRVLNLRSLCTRPSRSYEPGSRSGDPAIYARISGEWEMRPIGHRSPKRRIAFAGMASARVELWPEDCLWNESNRSSRRLGMWRIELGAHDSPGCYFHFQILGDQDKPRFPKAIPIPRLPSPFVTPMTAVEFVIGELFQDEWHRETSRTQHHHKRWRSIQRARWKALLSWQAKVVARDDSSPWMALKSAKPPNDLFVDS